MNEDEVVEVPEVVEEVEAVETPEVEKEPEFINSALEAQGGGDTSEKEEADTSTESEASAEDSPEDTAAKPNGVQKRINKLTAKARTAEREAAHWKSLAQEKGEEVAEPTIPVMPDVNLSLEDPVKYKEDMTAYNADLHQYNIGVAKFVNSEASTEAQTKETEALNTELDQEWSSNVSAFKDSVPDFDKLVERDDNPCSPAMFEIAKRSELGPEVLYELAKNPVEAMRIYQMNPIQTAHEMGKLEARLSVKPKKSSAAPAPINTVKGGGESVSKNSADLSMDDYAVDYWKKKAAQQN